MKFANLSFFTYLIKTNKFAFSLSELALSLAIMMILSKKMFVLACFSFSYSGFEDIQTKNCCDGDFYIGENDLDDIIVNTKKKEIELTHTHT